MHIPVWLLWLMLVPAAAIMALYLVSLLLLVLGVVSFAVDAGLKVACARASRLAGWGAPRVTWCLTALVSPFRQHGPWLDYAAVALLLVGASFGCILWLAA